MVNWDNYNESLVRRGEVILDFDVLLIDSWGNELDNMNNGKERKVVVHPINIQILLFNCLIGYMREHIFIYHHIDRQTEGVVRERENILLAVNYALFQITVQ